MNLRYIRFFFLLASVVNTNFNDRFQIAIHCDDMILITIPAILMVVTEHLHFPIDNKIGNIMTPVMLLIVYNQYHQNGDNSNFNILKVLLS